MPITLIRGDTPSVLLPLHIGASPYFPPSGTAITLFVKLNDGAPAYAPVIVQKSLGSGLTILGSSAQATFLSSDFSGYTQTTVAPLFYYHFVAQETGVGGFSGYVGDDYIYLQSDITRLTGVSIPIYTGNPPYPAGYPYPP